jgi:hypothetical protein
MSRQNEHEVRTKAAIVPVLLSIIAGLLTFFGTVFYSAFERIEGKMDAVSDQVITHQDDILYLKGAILELKATANQNQTDILSLQKIVGKHEDEYQPNINRHP